MVRGGIKEVLQGEHHSSFVKSGSCVFICHRKSCQGGAQKKAVTVCCKEHFFLRIINIEGMDWPGYCARAKFI